MNSKELNFFGFSEENRSPYYFLIFANSNVGFFLRKQRVKIQYVAESKNLGIGGHEIPEDSRSLLIYNLVY